MLPFSDPVPLDVARQVDPNVTGDVFFDDDDRIIVGSSSTEVNSDRGMFSFDSVNLVVAIDSTRTGAGTVRPLVFRTGDPLVERMTITPTGEVAIGATAASGTEKLRLVGGFRCEGFIESNNQGGAAVSAASEGRIRYNSATQTWQISQNTAAYVDIGTSTIAGGWTDTGTLVRLTTSSDTVAIGTSSPASSVLHVFSTTLMTILERRAGGVVTPLNLRNFRSPATINDGIRVDFELLQSGGVGFIYSALRETSLNVTAGSETARFEILVAGGGTALSDYQIDESADIHVWSLNSAEQMRLNLNGLGIGVAAGAGFKLDVTGNARITGKLTVTGAIDPTDITLSGGGTAHFMEWAQGSTAAVSAASAMRIRYNEGSNTAQVSLNGAAYADFVVGAGAGGWTDDGTIVRLTTSTDSVAIGTAALLGTEKLRVTGNTIIFDFTSATAFQVTPTGGGTPSLVVDTSTPRLRFGAGATVAAGLTEFRRDQNSVTRSVVENQTSGTLAETYWFATAATMNALFGCTSAGFTAVTSRDASQLVILAGSNNTNGITFTTSANAGMFWRTNADAGGNQERMRLTASGQLLIASTAAGAAVKLKVAGDALVEFTSTTALEVTTSAGGTPKLTVDTSTPRIRFGDGATTVVGVCEIRREQNNPSRIVIENQTSGTAAEALFHAVAGSGGTVVTGFFGCTSPGFTATNAESAAQIVIFSGGGATNGIAVVTSGAHPIIFRTNTDAGGTVEAMRVTSTKQLLIGATTAVGSERLRLTGGTAMFDFTSTTAFQVAQTGGGTPAIIVNTTNTRVGINVTPTTTFHVSGTSNLAGDVQVSGTVVIESDRDIAITLLPNADNSLNLGSGARRWANLFAVTTTIGDLVLKDETMRSEWEVREAKLKGEDRHALYAIDRTTGKKYRLMLEEVA